MKKLFRSLLLHSIIVFTMMVGCQAQPSGEKIGNSMKGKNILIVYLSRTSNTKAMAEMIQRKVGGTLVALELQTPYPADYHTIVAQVRQENESGYLPTLKTHIRDIEQHDVVFIGFPTWSMQLPPPIKSFLHQYDLGGMTIVPFNTNAGYGSGNSFETVKALCPKSKVLEALSLKGGIERDGMLFVMKGQKARQAEKAITKWLQKIELL